jgi:hypothetical protein
MSSTELLYVAAGATVVLALIAVKATLRRRRRSWRARSRSRRALAGELDAEALLQAHGYRVCERQVRASYVARVDDAEVDVALRVDLLVERDGGRFVAEVKTGEVAPDLTTAATRRQLLEYATALDVDGVLLVAPERGRVVRVEFPGGARAAAPGGPRAGAAPRAFVVGAVAGAAAAWLLAAW